MTVKRDYSNDPFRVALRKLMDDQGLTVRPLLEKAGKFRTGERAGEPFTTGFYSQIMQDKTGVSPDTLEAFAAALGVKPEYFKEWRQHEAAKRARELEEQLGLGEVLRRLERK